MIEEKLLKQKTNVNQDNNNVKNWFFEKTNEKASERLIKEKREDTNNTYK